jgi:HK97 family phage prohead protease
MTTTLEPQTRTLVVPLEAVEWRDSGDPERKDETTLRGHAAVFNSLSEDLGGFREIIEPGFFRDALRRKPDVRLLVNHDGLPLARTASGTLELREDARGLHVFARLDRGDPDVEQLRRKMQRGDVDQMSFAFTLREDGDEWEDTEDGIVRRLLPDGADNLYDVSVVTYPAYRATEVSMRSVLQDAISRGRLPISVARAEEVASDEANSAVAITVDESVTLMVEGSAVVAQETEGEERDVEPEAGVEQAAGLVAELKESTRARRDAATKSYLRLLKEHGLPT